MPNSSLLAGGLARSEFDLGQQSGREWYFSARRKTRIRLAESPVPSDSLTCLDLVKNHTTFKLIGHSESFCRGFYLAAMREIALRGEDCSAEFVAKCRCILGAFGVSGWLDTVPDDIVNGGPFGSAVAEVQENPNDINPSGGKYADFSAGLIERIANYRARINELVSRVAAIDDFDDAETDDHDDPASVNRGDIPFAGGAEFSRLTYELLTGESHPGDIEPAADVVPEAIPPDGSVLSVDQWLQVLGVDAAAVEQFRESLRRSGAKFQIVRNTRQTREAWSAANLGTLQAAGLTIGFPTTEPDCITIGFRSHFELPLAGDVRSDLLRWVATMEGRLQSIRETVDALKVGPFNAGSGKGGAA